MALYRFKVDNEDVIPHPYPLNLYYWKLTEKEQDGDFVYGMAVEILSVPDLQRYWPNAYDIEEVTPEEKETLKLYLTRPLTGNEHPLIRIKMNYPKNRPTPLNPNPELKWWVMGGGLGYNTLVVCVESVMDLRENWPYAWGVSLIADNLKI